MLFGFCLMYGIARLDYHTLERFAVPAYLISLALSGAVLLFGDAYNGSRRWLSYRPFSFQPAEYAKPAVILLLASAVSRIQGKVGWWRSAAVFALVLPIVGLVGTNNLSTAVIILGIAGILLFISNRRYLPFLWMLLAGSGFLGIFLSLGGIPGWNGWRFWRIRSSMRKGTRRCRDCMRSAPEGCSDAG